VTRPLDKTEISGIDDESADPEQGRVFAPDAAAQRRRPAAELDIWRDPARPVDERVADLLARMTPAERIAQLGSVWIGASDEGEGVAPGQDMFRDEMPPLDEVLADGLGQLTRVFGSRPVSPAAGMRALVSLQAKVVAASRFGIPAIAHEECLTGFAAWTATIFPTPLAWGASFDPALVRDMARAFGANMQSVGIHQGLAPVLDVTRDPRWGRTEETIGEDPYLVGIIGTGYVLGLQAVGIQGRAQPGTGVHGPARVRRRHRAAVRDGHQARRRPLCDALLHRHRRRSRHRRPGTARHPAPGQARLRRPGRL
jgi:beta-xylosidase